MRGIGIRIRSTGIRIPPNALTYITVTIFESGNLFLLTKNLKTLQLKKNINFFKSRFSISGLGHSARHWHPDPKHRYPDSSQRPFSAAATSVSCGVLASWWTTCGPAPAHPHSAAQTGKSCVFASVQDPDPDPWDPYVFGPLGSASVCHK